MRGSVLVGCALVFMACGSDPKPKKVKKPKADDAEETEKPETEADREKKRRQLAAAIVPEDSSCLPTKLKDENAPRLELMASGPEAIVCAVDTDTDRLLGPVGCWKVNLPAGDLTYKEMSLLPSRGFAVRLDERCARGYCIPKGAKIDGETAFIAKNTDGSKVAVLVGDDVHLFDAEEQEHESSFSIRGDKGVTNDPTALHFVRDTIIVEGADAGPYAAVWVFKEDGTKVGPVMSLGGKEEKPLSTHRGSFSILDKDRIAVSEKGMETLTTYQIDNGARAKLVRKLPKTPCKAAELDAYWHDGDKVSDKCKESMTKASGHLMGATVVAGGKSLLVLLRGERLGELGVLDSKTLAEKSVIKLPWCEAGEEKGDKKAESEDDDEADEKAKAKDKDAPKAKKPARKAKDSDSSDPEEGGE
jgi:hypothetical protein